MNIHEVINLTHEKENKLKMSVKKIVECIHKKIMYYAKHKKESCTYFIPAMIDDFPIYDRVYATKEAYKMLNEQGYIVSAYANGQIDICWNEKLVNTKLNHDRYILQKEESRLVKLNHKNKIINDRFTFLANPNKINNEQTLEQKLDNQVERLLKEKDREQKQISKKVGNFTKIMY